MRLPSVFLVVSFFFLTCCTTLTPKFKGAVFLHDQIPEELCSDRLKEFGLYRRLSNGDYEVLSYCSKEIKNYLAIHGHEFELVEDSASE